jgi:SAM-dependent methyltransferase
VLEFGCAHGHVTLALAAAFPQARFVGIDFMERSIKLAQGSAEAAGITNAEFRVGSLGSLLAEDLFGACDAVIAPEVLEHIWDYRDALEKLLTAVKPGGELILTTPNGRWEWCGRENWHKGRQHLHHFERQDLEELFEGFQHTILHAPAGHDPGGAPVGSWVTGVTKSGAELGAIDYSRKLASQAPRETVSLCVIVRDAQETIGAAIRSVADYVDEVVIAVDPNTKDRTYARIYELEERYPNLPFKVFEGKSPIDIGFDEARNATVDASCGDWILWMDADEEATGAQNLFRLLRPGCFDGYAIAQHHMSQAPAERISTDYPTRLFRRDSGARFYGVVHEHPEVQIGKAVPHTQQLGDFSLLHYGYIDEATRRARHRRNLPLLMRDLEKYPPRIINKFLYLRDLAQLMAYEGESTGQVSEGMAAKARRAIQLFEELIDANPMFRMTLDAVPYYSTAVAVLGTGFNVKLNIETTKAEFPGVSAAAKIDGMFHSVETFQRFMTRTAKETSLNYEGEYI